MGKNTTIEPAVVDETTANTTESTTEGAATVASDEIEIFVPRRYKGDNQRAVHINGKRYLVKVGVPVKVPKCVAEVLNRSINQREAYNAMIEKLEAENQKQ